MRKYLVLILITLLALAISGCLFQPAPTPAPTKAILKGQVVVPEGAFRQVGGQALPGATVNIIDPKTGEIIATTITDANGKYQVEVPPGGPYIIEAVKGNIKVLDVSPQVEVGQTYDLGTADATSTAVALVFQARVAAGEDPAQINLDEILEDPKIGNLIQAVEEALEAGEDPTTTSEVEELVNVIVTPPSPSPAPGYEPTYTPTPTTSPTPAPTLTGYGTIRIVIQKSKLIPQNADSLLLIVRDANRKIVQTFDLPEGGSTYTVSLNVPVSIYDVYAFSLKDTQLSIVSRWILTSGKQKSVSVQENQTTQVMITLQPLTYSFTISPETVSSGNPFQVEATARGAGVEIWEEPFLISAYFAYSTSSWSPDELDSTNLIKIYRQSLERVGEDSIKATFIVNAPSVSADTTLYYRVIFYQPDYDYIDYINYSPYLCLPNTVLSEGEQCRELQVTTGKTGTLSIILN